MASRSSQAVPLIKDDAKWEWGLVEAPAMVRAPAATRCSIRRHLRLDPNERLSRYATGYALCTGPLGPCQTPPKIRSSTVSTIARRDALAAPAILASFRSGAHVHGLPRLGRDQGLPQA